MIVMDKAEAEEYHSFRLRDRKPGSQNDGEILPIVFLAHDTHAVKQRQPGWSCVANRPVEAAQPFRFFLRNADACVSTMFLRPARHVWSTGAWLFRRRNGLRATHNDVGSRDETFDEL